MRDCKAYRRKPHRNIGSTCYLVHGVVCMKSPIRSDPYTRPGVAFLLPQECGNPASCMSRLILNRPMADQSGQSFLHVAGQCPLGSSQLSHFGVDVSVGCQCHIRVPQHQ
jgi:hypothetical protein